MLCVCLDVWDLDKRCVFVWMCGTPTSDVCLSGCVGLRQVLCVCLDVWDSDKCCVFFWMCRTQTSDECVSGCVRLRQVLCVCLHVWDSSKCCVFALFIYCICSIHCMCGTLKSAVFFWMLGIQTSAVCLSGCVGLGQVLCVCLDVWDSVKCCVFVWMCGT